MKLKFLRKVPAPNGAPYQFVEGRVFHNGAMIYTFNSWPLPVQPLIGPATQAGAMSLLQPPQIYQIQAVPIVGLGGLQAGQIVTQPLVNPDLSMIDPPDLMGGGE